MATPTMPDKPSSDYDLMRPYWRKVQAVTEGLEAMRAGGTEFLPKFESEDQAQYDARVANARFTNIYSDIVENLADRPFAKEVSITAGSETVKKLAEDIDGQGNNLHNFLHTYFRNAIDYSVDWIYVDYTRVNPETTDASGQVRRKSVAEERASGARPYWVRVPALEMIAVYSAVINGNEDFVHCRMLERRKIRAGWDEVEVVQVRELNREPIFDADGNIIMWGNATFRVWEQKDQRIEQGRRHVTKKNVWTIVDEGDLAIGVIPIVPLVIGERKGTTWQIIPAMKSCLDLQLEYYEDENGLKNIKKLTAYPMLTASGVEPERDDKGGIKRAPVGPRATLYAPPGEGGPGNWSFIEPAGSSLTFLRGELDSMEDHLRELGRQPLTAQSGNITSITAGSAATKGNSAIQRWALACKDAAENAMFYTALWLKETLEPTVQVFTDFALDGAGEAGMTDLLKMRADGDLSQETLWDEAKRRKVLSDEFDPKKEVTRLEDEMPSDDELNASLLPGQIDPRTGRPFEPEEDEEETTSPDPDEE